MKLPFNVDLTNKVVVITGAGGVICSTLAKALAMCDAKVAILDLCFDSAKKVADDIVSCGGIALPYEVNCLDKVSLEKCHEQILVDFGKCDILINGAGGNNPKGTTTKEYYEMNDENLEEVKSFFDLDPSGIEFVFNLNFLGTLLPSQVFALDMVGNKESTIINISSMNAFTPLTKIPAYSG
ncbi:MAG: SDR family NAD(P)-dependent oxidoreductase, partial [Bacilli bacterium]